MAAELLTRERLLLTATAFVDRDLEGTGSGARKCATVPVSSCLDLRWLCILRYDNEAGKGDHRHLGDAQAPYRFTGMEQMQADFWADVAEWRAGR